MSDLECQFSSISLALDSGFSDHIRRKLCNSNGHSLEFILDTGSLESLIPMKELRQFAPSARIQPTTISIKGITGHFVPIIGSCVIMIRKDDMKTVPLSFVVTKFGPAILGLKAMQALHVNFPLVTSNLNIESELKDLILKCSKATGGMKVPPIKLEVIDDPVFLKRRVIPYGLREPVLKVLTELCSQGIIEKIESSAWGTPIVTPLKSDGRTPRVCGDYRLTLNPRLLKQTCTTVEPEDILNKLTG